MLLTLTFFLSLMSQLSWKKNLLASGKPSIKVNEMELKKKKKWRGDDLFFSLFFVKKFTK